MEQKTKPQLSAGLLFAVTSLFWCAQYSYAHFINPELSRMGMSAAFMGLVSGAYGLTQTVLRIPLGMAADRIGRQRPFIVLGCMLTAFASAGMLLFYSPGGFLIFRGLAGVASASWVSFTVLFSGYFRTEEGPRRISQLNIANMLGRLAGFLIIILLVPALGVKSAFTFSLAAGVIALLFSLGLKETPTGRQGISLREMARVSKDPYLRTCSIIGILAQAVAFSTYYGFTVNIAKSLHADSTALSWLSIALLVPTLLLNFLLSFFLLKRFSAKKLVTWGFMAGALYSLLVPLATSITQLYLLQVLASLSSTLTFAVLLGQSVRDIKKERRAVAMGFFQAVYGIGMTIGPMVMGVLVDQAGLKTAFFFMAALSAASGALAWLVMAVPPKPA